MTYAKKLTALVIVALVTAVAVPTASAAQPAPEPAAAIVQQAVIVLDPPQSSRVSREFTVARSDRAQDMRGSLPSLYRGKYFYADQESTRKCIAGREGSFTYMVRGGGGNNYYGTYQFHRDFQRGAAYMMASESRKTHDGLRKAALKLRYVPINKWSRYWQDRAFYTVLNYNGKWTGKHHWNGGSHPC